MKTDKQFWAERINRAQGNDPFTDTGVSQVGKDMAEKILTRKKQEAAESTEESSVAQRKAIDEKLDTKEDNPPSTASELVANIIPPLKALKIVQSKRVVDPHEDNAELAAEGRDIARVERETGLNVLTDDQLIFKIQNASAHGMNIRPGEKSIKDLTLRVHTETGLVVGQTNSPVRGTKDIGIRTTREYTGQPHMPFKPEVIKMPSAIYTENIHPRFILTIDRLNDLLSRLP